MIRHPGNSFLADDQSPSAGIRYHDCISFTTLCVYIILIHRMLLLFFTDPKPVNLHTKYYTDIGCWIDRSVRALQSLEREGQLTDNYKTRADAVRKCYETALANGYQVFAVQDGGMCYSSGIAEERYDMYGSSTKCPPDGEGGSYLNQVYKINKPAPFKSIGCWTDVSSSRAMK